MTSSGGSRRSRRASRAASTTGGEEDALTAALQAVHAELSGRVEGKVASYIPELARVDPDLFGLAACTVDGRVVGAGDVAHELTIQSVSKPFLYGLALTDHGLEHVHARVGVEPTGDAFDSIVKLDTGTNRPHNPMVNAGAIAVTSLVRGERRTERLRRILELLREHAGRPDLQVDVPVYLSERTTGHRNRAIAHLMRHFGMVSGDIEDTLDLYFQQCSVLVSCRDLSVMAATLANGGVNPVTGRRALAAEHVPRVLTIMATCGLYDAAGQFLFRAGLPAKSGVSGGVIAVVPGRLGLAAFSPRLDAQGNSARGVAAVTALSRRLGLHVFGGQAEADALDRPAPSAWRGRAASGASERRARAARAPGEPDGSPSPAEAPRAAAQEAIVRAPVVARGLPQALDAHDVQRAVRQAHARWKGEPGGEVASYVPELATADPAWFGVAVVLPDGREVVAGDVDRPFTIQAAANPFSYALALEARGVDGVHGKVGVEPSGNPFNAILLDPRAHRPWNPMGNAGAITISSLVPGKDPTERLQRVLTCFADCAGVDTLHVDLQVFLSEKQNGDRNRAIACLLRNFGVLHDEEAALELYLQQCSVRVTCRQLARMGATLASGGRNPVTGVQAIPADLVPAVLSIMFTCGMHDGSGQFAFDVGLAAKSGISGGVVAAAPGLLGAGVYSPPVNAQGASVRGVGVLGDLARELRLGVFDHGGRAAPGPKGRSGRAPR